MEALKNYQETMFMKLPNTPEVWRVKDELWADDGGQMCGTVLLM